MESNAKRLFAAVPVPDSIRKTIAAKQQRWQTLAPFRKWTHPDDLHITLVFIGQTEPTQIPSLIHHIRLAASGQPPFTLSLHSIGSFGRPQKPSILWIGVEGDLDRLNRLQRELHNNISQLGFPLDQRPYSPHLTVARQYTGSAPFESTSLQLAQLDDELKSEQARLGGTSTNKPQSELVRTLTGETSADPATTIGNEPQTDWVWTVDRIAMYESRPGRFPMYEPIEWFSLDLGGIASNQAATTFQ